MSRLATDRIAPRGGRSDSEAQLATHLAPPGRPTAMSAQEKAAARDAILAAERLSDESSAVRVVRAICVTCLAVGSVTCILVALLGPRTSSMKIPLLSAPPLAQLTLDDSLRKPSSSASPPPPRRSVRVAKGHAAKAHAAAAPDGGTCYTFGHNARGEQFCIANEQARVWCARHTTPKLSRTSRTAYVWMAARPSCCADGLLSKADGCPREYPEAPRTLPPPLANATRKRGGAKKAKPGKKPAKKKRARAPTFVPDR